MSRGSDPWSDIEILLDLARVEEEVLLAVMEALGELYEPEADEFSWDDYPQGERPWGDPPMNVVHN